MKTAEEFRERQVQTLARALQRPFFFVGLGRCADLYYSNILRDLCWLDGREADFKAVHRQLLAGPVGVYG